MTSEELQAMLQAAYSGQVNPAGMGLNADPRSEWESYTYNLANPGRTEGEPPAMALSDYPKVWYDRIIGQPLQGMTGAGDALLGRTNPDLETFNKDVLDALSLYAGPTIAKGMLGGVPRATELSIFGGVGAKEAPLRMRDIAEKALAAGKDPDEVWKYTGWKPGMEGKMRFEISDKDMALNPEFWGQGGAKYSSWMDPKKNEWADIRMGQVAKHDAAYANYPEMRDVKVRLGQPESMGGKNGFYDEATNTATIKANLTKKEALETLLHEVGGHFVQKVEGFAKGGSADEFFGEAYRQAMMMHPYASNTTLSDMASKASFKKYKNIAGEIESEDIVNRRTWDTDMRRAVPPDMRKDAIIRMGSPDTDAFVADVLKELNY